MKMKALFWCAYGIDDEECKKTSNGQNIYVLNRFIYWQFPSLPDDINSRIVLDTILQRADTFSLRIDAVASTEKVPGIL